MNAELPGIEKPEQSWTYHWPERYSKILEAASKLVVDKDGNIYFVGKNHYLYSIDTHGELRWKKDNFYGPIEITEEGIITQRRLSYIELLDFSGQTIWSVKFQILDDFWLAPDGTLVVYNGGYLIYLDANGKQNRIMKLEMII